MTPLEIKILLHYYCSAEDYPHLSPPAQQDALSYFLRTGYLEKVERSSETPACTPFYRATEKLHIYCEALCKVPEPRQIWVCS